MKAVLIIDMPNNCEECKITYFQEHGESSICYSGDWSKRPSWCPLRPLPQKKGKHGELHEYDTDIHYEIGWNACLKEITGDKE